MKYRVICSDLDGTLLNSASTLSKENSSAINAMRKKGTILVPTTGRAYQELPSSVLEEAGFDYLIVSNGALIKNVKSSEIIKANYLEKETLVKIFKIFSKYDVFLLSHIDEKCYIDARLLKNHEKYNFSRGYYKIFEIVERLNENIADFTLEKDKVEMLCAIFADENEGKACIEELSRIDGTVTTSSNGSNAEIISQNAGKGNALKAFSEYIGIPKDEFIAVGDSGNDISMLDAAGLGLAVANAEEKTKAAADEIICKNDEHIAKYILENIL